jgi:hypothetical protein
MLVFRCSMFGQLTSNIENPNIQHRKPNIEQRKWGSSLFRQGESPNGFSYWCNKAKAETRSLGFSDFIIILLFSSLKISNVTK